MKKKQKDDINTMFLVPKRIYLAVREVIGEDDKVNQLDRLNNDSNYIEKAIQFRQQKSYKSQPEDSKKTVSTSVNTMNNIGQSTLIEGESATARNSEELSHDEHTSASTSGVSPLEDPHFIFPPVNQSELKNVTHQEEISLLHQGNAAENPLDSVPQPKRHKPSNISMKKRDVRPKLRCSFCHYATYTRPYFLMEHLRKKHNYRPSLEEERSARETLAKAAIERDKNKTKEPLPSFRGKRKNVDDEDESDIPLKRRKQVSKKPLPSFRGKRKNSDDEDESGIPSKRRKQVSKKTLPSFRGKRKSTDDEDESGIPLKRRKQVSKKTLPSFRGKRKNTNDTDESGIPLKRRKQAYIYKDYEENEPLSKLRRNKKNKKLRKNPFYKKPLKVEQRKELLPAQVKLQKLNIKKNPFYKKFPKLNIRKF